MYADPSGQEPKWWQWTLGAIGVALVVTAAALAIFATGGLGAFGVGALWGSLIVGGTGAIVGGAIGYATGDVDGILGGALTGFGIGAIIGFIAGGFYTYGQYNAAQNYLAQSGMSQSKQIETLNSFRKGSIRVKTLRTDTSVIRYWDGVNAMEKGRYLTTRLYANPIDKLSLAYGNAATNVSSFTIQQGTTLLTGKAAAVGSLHGGGIQWFINYIAWLIAI